MALTRATDKIIANADGNLNLSGIVTASSFRGDGSQLTGIDASTLKNGSDTKAQANASGVVVTGVLTATSFRGDGSNLTNLPAGLGTALSSDQTSANNKLYYTNRVLSIGSTTTVDHPATASGAYTQYAEIQIEDNADLIIEDGDDLIPDILGLGDNGSTGAGGLGRLRVDTITNKSANGAPTATNGLTVTGVVTATSFVGNGSGLTNLATDLVNDTSPQLGGNLDTNSFEISLDDGHNINFGDGADCTMKHSGADFAIINTTGNLNILNNSDQAVQIRHGSETMIKAISDGAVELYHNGTKMCETSANGLAFPSGKGIDFSASGNTGGMTGELLNDYEEGTWTPEIKGTTGAGTASYNNQVGKYLKIGNWVYLTWVLGWSSGSAGGEMRTTGFPFTPATDCTGMGSVMFNNVSIHSSVSNIATYIGPTNAYCYFYTSRSSAGWITVNYSSSGNLIANVSFRTA